MIDCSVFGFPACEYSMQVAASGCSLFCMLSFLIFSLYLLIVHIDAIHKS